MAGLLEGRTVVTEQVFTGGLRPFPGVKRTENPVRAGLMYEVLKDVDGLGLAAEFSTYADFEDFWEDAFRASAAVCACKGAGVPLRLAEDGKALDPSVRLGPVSVSEEGTHCVDKLLMPDALIEHGGREMARAWIDVSEDAIRGVRDPSEKFENMGSSIADEECPTDFFGALMWFYWKDIRAVVIKSANRKTGVSSIVNSPRLSALRDTVARDELLCWSTVPDAAPAAGFLIQQWVPMRYEYRLFIVDGVPVSGAGCVEEFTPLDHLWLEENPFDPQMRMLRGNGIAAHGDTEVERRYDLVERYLEFATPIAKSLPTEMNTVVMDVALGAHTDEPLIVEFNTLPNSGLYASDVHAVYRALVAADNRGYV